MPFSRPTLQELVNRTAADAQARLGLDELLRRDDLQVLTRVHAGAVHGLYGYLEWLSRQVIFDTAEAEYLERWASIWGVARKPAAAATGDVVFTGVNGAVVPAGAALIRADGAEYFTTADANLTGGTATAPVEAVTPGATGNALAGVSLGLTSPVAGVSSTVLVGAAGLSGGADVEDDASLRDRFIARIQQPPQGGASNDYVTWALEVPGVTRAWVSPQELGIGTVTVRFVRDDDATIIPDAGEVAAVQAHIDTRRPVTASATVVAPVAVPLDFTIGLTPNTAAAQAAVQAELADLIRREAAPGGTVLLSHIREAISIAAGETNHTLSVPTADVTHSIGQMAVMGTITWL